MSYSEVKVEIGTMQALILEKPGALTLKAIPIPIPGPGEILIRVVVATTCGTDLKAFLRGHPQIPTPGVFGHEYSGVVASVGEGVTSFQPGDEVMGVHSAPCGSCEWCRNGDENLCEHIMETKVLGSYAEYLLIPAHIAKVHVFKKPAEVSFSRASLLEPLACVAHGLNMLQANSNNTVLIIGPGAIGLLFTAILKSLGFGSVTVAGRNQERLAIAAGLGANTLNWTDSVQPTAERYDCVIECTGRVEVWERSIDFCKRGSKLMLFGGCPTGTRASFDTGRLHYDQITVLSPFHFGTTAVKQAKEWICDLSIPVDRLVTGDRDLRDAEAVFNDLAEGIGVKYALRP